MPMTVGTAGIMGDFNDNDSGTVGIMVAFNARDQRFELI